jgi:hypothetical protein
MGARSRLAALSHGAYCIASCRQGGAGGIHTYILPILFSHHCAEALNHRDVHRHYVTVDMGALCNIAHIWPSSELNTGTRHSEQNGTDSRLGLMRC